MAFAACGYKCPVKPCAYKLAPRTGKISKEHLERDAAGHLLRLLDEPQVREIFDHWEQNHCPASAHAQVKAQCPYFDADSKGCSSWLHPRPYDLKRHLLTVHGVEDTSQYDLKAKYERVNKSKPTRPAFEPVTARELIDVFTRV